MTHHYARLISACALASTVLLGCGPSIDPAAKADIDRRVATLKPRGQNYPAPAAFIPRPYVVGQWTQHKLVDDKGQPSFMTYKVVGQDGGAYWVEMSNESYLGKNITKMLLSIGDCMNPESVEDPRGQDPRQRWPRDRVRPEHAGADEVDVEGRRGHALRIVAGPIPGDRDSSRRNLRQRVQGAHRSQLGSLAGHLHIVVSPRGPAVRAGEEPGDRQAEQHGAGRLRRVRRPKRAPLAARS